MARRISFYTRFSIGKYRAAKKLEQDELVRKMIETKTDLSRKRTKLKRLQDRVSSVDRSTSELNNKVCDLHQQEQL